MPLQAWEKSFGLHSLSDEPFCSWIHLQSDAVYETRVTALTAKEHIPDTIWRIAPLIIFDLSRPSPFFLHQNSCSKLTFSQTSGHCVIFSPEPLVGWYARIRCVSVGCVHWGLSGCLIQLAMH